jgi:DnaA family protein
MQQLPLNISTPARPDFENFVAGRNAEALASVRALASGTLVERIVYVWGEAASGRSHLLHAAERANPELVIADGVEKLDDQAQQALFNAINAAREGQAAVLASGDQPPAGLALREDLRTRLAWGLVFHLKPLDDLEKAGQLRREAQRRGLHLGDDVVGYLLTRFPRDLSALQNVLEVLDRYALARQRALTLPLVKDAFAAGELSRLVPRHPDAR